MSLQLLTPRHANFVSAEIEVPFTKKGRNSIFPRVRSNYQHLEIFVVLIKRNKTLDCGVYVP